MFLHQRKLKSTLLMGLFAINLVVTSLFLSSIVGNPVIQPNNESQLLSSQTADMADPISWWDADWDYRVRVEVNNSNAEMIKETPLEKRINFTDLLNQVGDSERLDNQSIRVVEYTQSGEWVEMRSRWNATEDTANYYQNGSYLYDDGLDIFDITWTLNGTTQANQNRTFFIYFNSEGASVKVGIPDYGFDATHLNYVDYIKIADFSAGYLNVTNPWDRNYWTAAEGLKDPYTAAMTKNNTFNPFVSNLNYEGWVHQYLGTNGRQTHVGETSGDVPAGGYFPIQWSVGSGYRWTIAQYPILTVTMRVDNPATLTSVFMATSAYGWNVTGYTPNSRDTQGTGANYDWDVDKVNGFTIICDGQWHTYAYDMRRITLSTSAYVSCIEMFQNTGGSALNITFDNMFFYKSEVSGVDSLYSNYSRILPKTWVGEAHVKSATLRVQCEDVDGNPLPNANITLVNSTDGAVLRYNSTNAAGYTLFQDISFGNYSFEANLHSNVVDGLSCLVNSTVGVENATINSLYPVVTLMCQASRTIFTLKDVNGDPVESGWVLTGNDTYWGGIQNASIGADGKAYFYWYNVTPHTDFKYNYTVFYQNASYRETSSGLDTVVLVTGTIESANRTELTLWTTLTTQYFTILTDTLSPIPGAEIRITNSSGHGSVVDLITDANGNAVFRWLIANETDGNSNYTIEIFFFDDPKNFNSTWEPSTKGMNVTLNLKQYWELRVIITLSAYQTALVSLIPEGIIETEWGQEIRARVLFNVTATEVGTLGPTWASYVNYLLKLGETVVLSGSFYQVPYYTGWYEASINTTLLTGNSYYTLVISGAKSGYTNPSPIPISVYVGNAPSSLTLSAGSATINTWWNDTESISVDFAVTAGEQINIQDVFDTMAMSGTLSLWDLQNNWNLTKVVFNFDNVYWDETLAGSIDLTVTGPDGFITANLANAVPITQTSIDLTHANVRNLVYEHNHGSKANSYLFTIGGNFDNAVSGNLTAYFVRNQVNATFITEIESSDTTLSIKRFSSGWSINYLNITLSDISGTLPFDLGDISITLPTGATYDFVPAGSLGCLEIFDLDLYPSNDSWVFGIKNDGRTFTATIIAGMRQVVSINSLLENIKTEQTFSGISTGSTILITIDGNQFSSGTTVLHVTNLVDAFTGVAIYPEDANLLFTIGTSIYVFEDLQSPGEAYVTLDSMQLAILHNYAFLNTSSVYFNVTLEEVLSRSTSSTTTGTITYLVREEPSIYGLLMSVPDTTGQYAVNFYTGVLDARSYTFQIRSARANFATAALDLDLNIAKLPTQVGVYGEPGAVDFIFNDQINVTYGRNYSLYLNDTHNSKPVVGAIASYTWRRLDATTNVLLESGTDIMIDNNNGSYTLDFITPNTKVGKYTFLFSFAKDNYETRSAFIEVNVQIKLIMYELEDFTEGGIIKKPQGETIVIAIKLKDVAAGGIALTGATVKLYFNNQWVDMTPDGTIAGRYFCIIDTSTYNALFAEIDFESKIIVTMDNYTIGKAEIRFTVGVAPPELAGIPVIYWIIAITAIVVMVGGFAIVKGVQHARIPQIIKNISRTRGEIKKRRTLDKIEISPTKAEQIQKLLEGEWATIGETYPAAPKEEKGEEPRSVPEEIEKKEATG